MTPPSAPGSTLTLTVEGSGFDPAASVPEIYGPDGALLATAVVRERSTARIAATAPLAGAPPGAYTVKVLNPDGRRSNAAPLQLVGEVHVSPASGRPGQPFTYSGRGFTGHSGVTSHLQGPDGLEWQAKRIGTSPEGTFEQTIVSGQFVPGTYTVWAKDDRMNVTSARFTFEVVGPPATGSSGP
ncbi:MAG TPA: hypothetical protein VGQ28_01230 [Thermoanaerobaculia bacterium]|nr:hypothetical protein [Thermoanaerobaculia bacterium]